MYKGQAVRVKKRGKKKVKILYKSLQLVRGEGVPLPPLTGETKFESRGKSDDNEAGEEINFISKSLSGI